MAVSDKVQNTGHAVIEITRADGSVETLHADNLVVNSGLAWIASRTTDSPAVMSHMALGSNNTAVAGWNTTLYAETPGARIGLTSRSTSGNVTTYAATFGPGVGTGAVGEIGIFNAASGGTMLNRVALSTTEQKGSQDTFKVTWSVTQSA